MPASGPATARSPQPEGDAGDRRVTTFENGQYQPGAGVEVAVLDAERSSRRCPTPGPGRRWPRRGNRGHLRGSVPCSLIKSTVIPSSVLLAALVRRGQRSIRPGMAAAEHQLFWSVRDELPAPAAGVIFHFHLHRRQRIWAKTWRRGVFLWLPSCPAAHNSSSLPTLHQGCRCSVGDAASIARPCRSACSSLPECSTSFRQHIRQARIFQHGSMLPSASSSTRYPGAIDRSHPVVHQNGNHLQHTRRSARPTSQRSPPPA